jgi:exopolyphosphatase/guanosine-5'-triphosphate,3'-diphosphate pyrophosphatase
MILESRKLGAARMTARFVKHDPPDADDIERLRKFYRSELMPIMRGSIRPAGPQRLVGTSGTLENIAAMCALVKTGKRGRSDDDDGKSIPSAKLDTLVKLLLKTTSEQRASFPGLDAQRKDQIVAGVVLVQEIFAATRAAGLDHLDRVCMCDAALREGILVDYVERKLPKMQIRREVPDPRRRSVLDLCRRSQWHREHSEQVTGLTLRLFDDLQGVHGLGQLDRELIEYAAMMHDIGWHIGRKGHHKHSAYLIRHGKLKAFTDEEVEIMANIARYHRKATPGKKHDDYAALPARARRTVDVGAALLRVADGLDRSHAKVVRDISCKVKPDLVKIRLHTRADAQLEIWGATRKSELFEKVMKRPVEFEV